MDKLKIKLTDQEEKHLKEYFLNILFQKVYFYGQINKRPVIDFLSGQIVLFREIFPDLVSKINPFEINLVLEAHHSKNPMSLSDKKELFNRAYNYAWDEIKDIEPLERK